MADFLSNACRTCDHWRPRASGQQGDCTAHPPAIVNALMVFDEFGDETSAIARATVFPITDAGVSCGQHLGAEPEIPIC